MFPINITRSISEVNGGKQISTVFCATFADGSQKWLRDVRKNLGLAKPCEMGPENEAHLPKDVCPLYYKDWSDNPIFGSFKTNYPKPKSI